MPVRNAKQLPELDADTVASLPFQGDRRVDITIIFGVTMAAIQKVRLIEASDKAVAFVDERGNYYRFAMVPYTVSCWDPEFDPDSEGKLIRTGEMPGRRM